MARIDSTLPDEMLEDLDKYCENNHLQRSELIRHLIRIEIYMEHSLCKDTFCHINGRAVDNSDQGMIDAINEAEGADIKLK